ncbi:MAG: tyrosine-type recombinase/integrase, partial [Chloroflexota bacterium]
LTYAPLMTMAATGMRIGEVAGVRDQDVGDDGLHVVGQRRANDRRIADELQLPRLQYSDVKNGEEGERTLAFNAPIRDAVESARRFKKRFAVDNPGDWHDEGFLFCDQRGRPLEPRRLREALYRAQDRAGLPRARPHDFRKRVTTLLIRRGISPKVVAKWNGHTVRTALAFYEQVEKEDLEVAAAGLERSDPPTTIPAQPSDQLLERLRDALLRRGIADIDALLEEVNPERGKEAK